MPLRGTGGREEALELGGEGFVVVDDRIGVDLIGGAPASMAGGVSSSTATSPITATSSSNASATRCLRLATLTASQI